MINFNFLQPKLTVRYPKKNWNFLSAQRGMIYQRPIDHSRDSGIKFASIYILAFIILFFSLNFNSLILDRLNSSIAAPDQTNNLPVLPVQTPILRQDSNMTNTLIYSSDVASISIPKIQSDAPVVIDDTSDNNKLLDDLKRGVLMYPGSSRPGAGGTTVIVGHSSSDNPFAKYGRVFSRLGQLSIGDLIYINYNDKTYVYRVTAKNLGSIKDLEKLNINGDLILSSCWPIGTDKGRIIISANLQN